MEVLSSGLMFSMEMESSDGKGYLHEIENFALTRWKGHLDHHHFQVEFPAPFHRFPKVYDEGKLVPISLQWY